MRFQLPHADGDQDPEHRLREYHSIEQDVVDLCAWIPYDQEKCSWRVRPWVQGFGLNELLIMEDVDWPNVSISAHQMGNDMKVVLRFGAKWILYRLGEQATVAHEA